MLGIPVKREARLIAQLPAQTKASTQKRQGTTTEPEEMSNFQPRVPVFIGGAILGSSCFSPKTRPAGSAPSGRNVKGLWDVPTDPHVGKHVIPVIWGWNPWPSRGRCPHSWLSFHFFCLCCLEFCKASFCLISPWQEFWENTANIYESQIQGGMKSYSKKQNPHAKRTF